MVNFATSFTSENGFFEKLSNLFKFKRKELADL